MSRISYWEGKKVCLVHEGFDRKKLAEFGIRNKLSCGGTYIIGKGFVFEVSFSADSYESSFSDIREYNEEMTEGFHDFLVRLLEGDHISSLHFVGTKEECMRIIGLGTLIEHTEGELG